MVHIVLNEGIEFSLEVIGKENDYMSSCMYKFQNWEPNVTAKFTDVILQAHASSKSGIVIDAGACFGYYSIIAAKNNLKVKAYEPNPKVVPILLRNIESSGVQDKIKTYPYALGSSNSNLPLKTFDDNIGGTYISDSESASDLFISTQKLDDEQMVEDILIYKIDTEGYESEVISGSLKTIKNNNVEFIFVEVSPKFTTIDNILNSLFRVLWENNYISFDIGLQDSGQLTDAIKTFRRVSPSDDLEKYLLNIGQTNFIFIKQDSRSIPFFTGTNWKDSIIARWIKEYTSSLEAEVQLSKSKMGEVIMENDEVKKENRKLFNLINEAANYQRELEQRLNQHS